MIQKVQRCNICGRVERPDRDIWIHDFSGEPGYGSKYCLHKVTLQFCSECLENIIRPDNLLYEDKN